MAAVAVASAAGCAYLDTKQREWIFRAQRDLHSTPASYGLAFEEVWLTVAGDGDGARARVHGWWIPGPDAQAPTLLYLHGARRNLSEQPVPHPAPAAHGLRGARDRLPRLRPQRRRAALGGAGVRGRAGRLAASAPARARPAPALRLRPFARRRGRHRARDPQRRRRRADRGVDLHLDGRDGRRRWATATLPIGLVLTQHFDSLAKMGRSRRRCCSCTARPTGLSPPR